MRVAITYSATLRTSHLLQSIQQITTGWRLAGDNLTVLCPTSGRVAGDLQLTAAPVTASNTRFGARLRPATSVGSSVGRPMTGLRGSLPLVFLSRQCGEPWTWTPTAMSL